MGTVKQILLLVAGNLAFFLEVNMANAARYVTEVYLYFTNFIFGNLIFG